MRIRRKKKGPTQERDTHDINVSQTQDTIPILAAIDLQSQDDLFSAGRGQPAAGEEDRTLPRGQPEDASSGYSHEQETDACAVHACEECSCGDTVACDRKRKRRRLTKKSVRKAGYRLWRGCVVTWKFIKAGLTYYVGTPAASLNVTAVVTDHFARKADQTREKTASKHIYTPYDEHGHKRKLYN